MKISKLILFSGALLIIALGAITDARAQENSALVPMDPNLKIGRLENGFTYYIRKNIKPEGKANIYLVNNVGSILETDKQQGLAHFLEHMAFNGTKHFPKNELVEYLQKSGVRFGADLNAYTSYDETVYQLPITTTDKKIFNNAILIIRDWAQDLTLDDTEIDKERGVILEEKRQREGLRQRINNHLFPGMVNSSRYADRLPIGTEEVLKNFDHQEIRDFYKDWYRPDLQALIVVGDIDVNGVEKMIKSTFTSLKNPASPKERTKYKIPLTGKNQFKIVTDPEIQGVTVTCQIKHEDFVPKTEKDMEELLVRSLFNSMASERFSILSQSDTAAFFSANTSIQPIIANLEALMCNVILKPNMIKSGIESWWYELERIKRYGFTESELKRAKTNFLSNLELIYKTKTDVTSESFAKEYVEHFLKGYVIPGIDYEYPFYKRSVVGITLAQVNTFIQKYMLDTNRDIQIVANSKFQNELPNENQFAQWIEKVDHANIKPYEDVKSENIQLVENLSESKGLASEEKGTEGTTILTLKNGIKVVLKPTNFKKGQIVFNGFALGGLSAIEDKDYYAGSLAAELVGSSGIGKLSVVELNTYLTGKNLDVMPFISENTNGVNGETDVENLETALELTYLCFAEPRKDIGAYHRLMDRIKQSYETLEQEPGAVFRDTLRSVMSNYSIRARKPSKEEFEKISMEAIYKVYRDLFSDGNDFTFTFVGNFDVEKIKPLLIKYLGAIPSHGTVKQIHDVGTSFPKESITKKIVYGVDDKAYVGLVLTGDFDYNSQTNVYMEALSKVITFRLQNRLREEEGGVYTVGVNFNPRKYPKGQYAFAINFVCDPAKVEMLTISTISELMKLKTEGIEYDDLVKYKATSKTAMAAAKQSNNFWLRYITSQLTNEEKIDIQSMEKSIQKMTTEDVHQVAKDFLNLKSFINISLKPIH